MDGKLTIFLIDCAGSEDVEAAESEEGSRIVPDDSGDAPQLIEEPIVPDGNRHWRFFEIWCRHEVTRHARVRALRLLISNISFDAH
jgi:hypothetical protein